MQSNGHFSTSPGAPVWASCWKATSVPSSARTYAHEGDTEVAPLATSRSGSGEALCDDRPVGTRERVVHRRSKVFAIPSIMSGELTSSPGTGDSTTRGVRSATSRRSRAVAGTPSPPMPSVGARPVQKDRHRVDRVELRECEDHLREDGAPSTGCRRPTRTRRRDRPSRLRRGCRDRAAWCPVDLGRHADAGLEAVRPSRGALRLPLSRLAGVVTVRPATATFCVADEIGTNLRRGSLGGRRVLVVVPAAVVVTPERPASRHRRSGPGV